LWRRSGEEILILQKKKGLSACLQYPEMGLHWNGINSWEASWLKKHSLPKKTLNFSLNFLKTLQQDLNMP
jgi:hypothetical protein